MNSTETNQIITETREFLAQDDVLRKFLVLLLAATVAYWLSKFVAKWIIAVAQKVRHHADRETRDERIVRLRQTETYLSLGIAAVRVVIIAVVMFLAWRLLFPQAPSAVTTIGASAFFIVAAGGTIGVLLRDITSGAIIITEKWFHIGDYIKIEPFLDIDGVVERMTLRSTKLRSLSGETQWINNQYIQAVHVTPKALRTIAVDIFTERPDGAREIIGYAVGSIPIGALTLAKKPKISNDEAWGEGLWRISVTGQMPPGREWLMEQFFIDSVKLLDEKLVSEKRFAKSALARPMYARHADADAEKSFRRAVRTNRDEK